MATGDFEISPIGNRQSSMPIVNPHSQSAIVNLNLQSAVSKSAVLNRQSALDIVPLIVHPQVERLSSEVDVVGGDLVTEKSPHGAVVRFGNGQTAGERAHAIDQHQRRLLALPPRQAADFPIRNEAAVGPDPLLIEASPDLCTEWHRIRLVHEHRRFSEYIDDAHAQEGQLVDDEHAQHRTKHEDDPGEGMARTWPGEQCRMTQTAEAKELIEETEVGEEKAHAEQDQQICGVG